MARRVVTSGSLAVGTVFLLGAFALIWALYGARDVFRGADHPVLEAENAVADLTRWPFGPAERRFESDTPESGRIAFLAREVRKGFPVPAAWRPELDNARSRGRLYLLSTVNALINRTSYVPESRDRWKAPEVFLREGGDCDCFATAKYILLRQSGFLAKDLRITGVRLRKDNRLHAILIARTGPGKFERFVLDNASDYVRTALYMDAYVPLISLNEMGVWIHDRQGRALVKSFAFPAEP